MKSKDIRQQESGVATYVFIVLSPWYQTWTAYLAYTLIIGCFIYGVVRVRSRQLKNEKKKLERTVAEKTSEIQQQAEKLRELDKIKSQFFANISHEFRTPLTLILGPLEEKLKREERDYRELSLMHRNAKRLERLIDQLLDLSRIESGQLELHIIRDNITKHIKAFVSSFSSYADQQDIALDTDFSDDNELGYFDPDKLEKIVYNLLSNAFKFTPQGGKISVRTAIRGHRIYMKITDTGRGMTNEEASQIFNRFYRSQSSIKSEIEGLGIGLALTRELIILHGGEISVQSKPNQGSTFEFELPIGKEYYNKTKIEEVSTSLNSVSKIETEESVTNESLLEAEHMPLLLFV